MEWTLRDPEDFPTYSCHIGGILLEVYPHGDATDDGAVYDPSEPHWQGGFWMLAPGLEPHQGPLDAIQSCAAEPGTLAQKQAEVLELAKAWLKAQVEAFAALDAPVLSTAEVVCSACDMPHAFCECSR
jgi:hypothetical protein